MEFLDCFLKIKMYKSLEINSLKYLSINSYKVFKLPSVDCNKQKEWKLTV